MGISTHVLDTALGRPAVGVGLTLSIEDDGAWRPLCTAATDGDGRCRHLPVEGAAPVSGTYRIRFATADYYARLGVEGLYPYVDIVFTIRAGDEHVHIPLLLTANGYTTYRGS